MLNLVTLKRKLSALELASDEPTAIAGWTDAWVAYMQEAGAVGPIVGWALEAVPARAMKTAMLGMAVPGAGAAAIQAGIVAFWAAMAATPFTYFAGAVTITPPPGISSLVAPLLGALALNLLAPSQKIAMGRIAEIFHIANQGGTVTFASPPPVPIV
jgi:hypothetical protein